MCPLATIRTLSPAATHQSMNARAGCRGTRRNLPPTPTICAARSSASIPSPTVPTRSPKEISFRRGLRNPYRITVNKHTGFLYWGDVGPDANVDSVGRGPRGYDEINQARSAGNYGWPYFVGDNQAYYRTTFSDSVTVVPGE